MKKNIEKLNYNSPTLENAQKILITEFAPAIFQLIRENDGISANFLQK
jgi:hypothetical protein